MKFYSYNFHKNFPLFPEQVLFMAEVFLKTEMFLKIPRMLWWRSISRKLQASKAYAEHYMMATSAFHELIRENITNAGKFNFVSDQRAKYWKIFWKIPVLEIVESFCENCMRKMSCLVMESRGAFRNLLNIYGGAFLRKYFTSFSLQLCLQKVPLQIFDSVLYTPLQLIINWVFKYLYSFSETLRAD